MREKAAQEDALVLYLIRNAIGQTSFVAADFEPARKERINQNRRDCRAPLVPEKRSSNRA